MGAVRRTRRLVAVLAIVSTVVGTAAVASTPTAVAKPAKSNHGLQPTGVGRPPKGYPAAPKPLTRRPSKAASTATAASGDTLTVSQVHIGTFDPNNYTDYVPDGQGGIYFENCAPLNIGAYGGAQVPACAYIDIGCPNGLLCQQSNNSQTDSIMDACGSLVDTETTYGWNSGNTGYLGNGWIGSFPTRIPTTGVCFGLWTLTFSFTQTFSDGVTLTASGSGTFWVRETAAQLAADNPQLVPVGGGVTTLEDLGGCACGYSPHAQATGNPIDTATGNFWHTFDDLATPGRGPAFDLTRTYNSLVAGTDGPFGHGWTDSYAISLTLGQSSIVVNQGNGAQATFTLSNGEWTAPPRVKATLRQNGDGTWMFVRHAQMTYTFDSTGRLTAIEDLNGYTTTVTYPSGSQMVVTDPAGRAVIFTLTGGHVTAVSDSSSPTRTLSYTYDAAGDLTDVIDVGGGHWQFTYDGQHRLLTMRSPRYYGDTTTSPSPVITNHYDGQGRVDWQSDQLGRVSSFDYTSIANSTKVTDPKGNATVYEYTYGLLTAVTRGYGTSQAATWYYRYDPDTLGQTMAIDPESDVTQSSYNANGDLLSRTDALNRTTTYTYNALDEVTSTTEPKKINGHDITTTMTYDASGNLLSRSSPLLDADGNTAATATTVYHHDDNAHPGDVTSTTDPNNLTTRFGYDSEGDLISTTDPAGDKTTFGYDTAHGWRTSMVAPKGNATGGDPAAYTTTYDYDAYGRVTRTRDPLWSSSAPNQHQTVRHYDADGNLDSSTDGKNHTTTYTFDAAGEQTAVHRPDGTTLRSDYWPDGSVKDQYDGAGQATSYAYDALGHLSSVIDPLLRETDYSYDVLGNLITKKDPSGRITTDAYDFDNELTSITFSDGITPNVTNISYDADGQRIGMTDGTGTSSWTWDSLHRMTGSTNGAGATVGYQYDIGGRMTGIVYPGSTGTVARGYDDANRLHTVTDWNQNTTTFNYDPNSNLQSEVYPNGDTATSTYDDADRLTGIFDAPTSNPSASFATFGYGRDAGNQLASVSSTGVPTDNHSYGYDQLDRLTGVDQTSYTYDGAGNLTKQPDGTQQLYDNAHELTASSTSPAISLVGTTSVGDSTSKTLTLTLPAGTTAGDTVLLATTLDNNKSVTTPAGYSIVNTYSSGSANSDAKIVLYEHRVGSGETSVALTYQAKFGKSATLAVYRSVHQATPIDVSMSASNTAATTVDVPSITPTGTGDRLVLITGADGSAGTWSAPSSMTMRTQHSGGATDTALADQVLGSPSATGDRLATHTTSTKLVGILLALKPSQTSFAYDRDGNRTGLTPLSGATTTLRYDQADRLTGYGGSANFTYNGDGLRASKISSGTTTAYTWDQVDGSQLLADGSTSYIYGPNGAPIEQSNANGTAYFMQDQLGSTRALTNTTGGVVASYTYDSYGNLTGHTGAADTSLRWGGQYQDSETGLYYLRARYYDPTTGQFVSADPMASLSGNPYLYASGDPLNQTDPSGLCSINPFSGDSCLSDAADAVGDAVDSAAGWVNDNVVQPTENFVEDHKTAIGLGLGVLAVATGVGGLIAAGAFGATFAGTALGVVSLLAGGAATALDAGDCAAHPGINAACTATVLGGLGGLMGVPELAVGLGLIAEPEFQEFLALAIGGVVVADVAALIDALRALYDQLTGGACAK